MGWNFLKHIFNILILEREMKRGRDGNMDLLFYLPVHLLVGSYMCPK